jgi:CubicO group peptidase (beta-lactamase class C family)
MGSVLVARGTQVLFSKGYGSANLEWDVPNTPSTKFRLGSVTKQFTAA